MCIKVFKIHGGMYGGIRNGEWEGEGTGGQGRVEGRVNDAINTSIGLCQVITCPLRGMNRNKTPSCLKQTSLLFSFWSPIGTPR